MKRLSKEQILMLHTQLIYVVIDDIGSKKIMEVRRFFYNKQEREQLI